MKLEPSPEARGVCVDTPLRLRFDRPQQLGTAGVIDIRRADGSLADRIDLGDPSTHVRTVGDAVDDAGVKHPFRYHPVIVDGTTVGIHPRRQLDHGQSYSVTIDENVLVGFPGIRDETTWRFTTKAAPPRPNARMLRVAAEGPADFRTVQGAIDFVPLGNTRTITIRGRDRDRTVIQYANNNVLNGQPSDSHRPCRLEQDTLRLQGSGFVTNSHVEGDADFVIRNGAAHTGNVFVNTPIDTTARHPVSRRLTSEEAARWSEPAFVLGEWEPDCGT